MYPHDPDARKELLIKWLDGQNPGLVIEGINGINMFFSSSVRDIILRPKLNIQVSVE